MTAVKPESLAQQLDNIEAEMKRLGLCRPTQEVPKVTSAFGYDQMPFELWLASAFLPRARAAIDCDNLPADSQVGVAAMRNFDGDDRMNNLIALLHHFDQSVKRHARMRDSVSN